MTSEPRVIDVPGVPRFEVAPHHCFACGTLNEHSLGLVMHVEPERAWVETTLDRHSQGWDDIAHGGIVATILDEVMAWSLAGADNWGVTARMNVTYRKPVPLGVPIRADGWIARQRRRIIDTEARLVDARDGTELATATGVYVAADEARKQELRERYRLVGRVGAVNVAVPERPVSAATERAQDFVAARLDAAERLGAELAELSYEPDAFAARLREGFLALADPEYEDGQHFVAPGLGATYGVRRPLIAAVARGFRTATRRDPDGPLLFVADRLLREDHLEPRWFAFGLLQRTLATETEQTWQLLRRAAREADDWITVDDLAHPYARGIQDEAYRWAELELLVYSPSRWERRLIGSTIATMTHGARGKALGRVVVETALPILAQLMGDAEPDVQKALGWAYRSLAAVDRAATTAALGEQAERAVADDDGHRAWVIRDALPKLDAAVAADLKTRLAGIRKRPGAPSTSSAAATAARFGPLPDPRYHPEPPLG